MKQQVWKSFGWASGKCHLIYRALKHLLYMTDLDLLSRSDSSKSTVLVYPLRRYTSITTNKSLDPAILLQLVCTDD